MELLVGAMRDKIDAGILPLKDALKLWIGWGSGYECAVCDRPIFNSQSECEPEYEDGLPVLRFHAGCYSLWEAERRRRGYLPSELTPTSRTGARPSLPHDTSQY